MAGFFGWLKRTVNNITNAISQISHNPTFIWNIIDDAFNGNGFTLGNNRLSQRVNNHNSSTLISDFGLDPNVDLDVVLEARDVQILDIWVDNNFLPYYSSFFVRIQQFYVRTPSRAELFSLLNEAEMFIGLLNWYKEHIEATGDDSLSAVAVRERSKFISIQLGLLSSEINEYFRLQGLSLIYKNVKRNVFKYDFSFLDLKMPESINIYLRQYGNNLVDESPIEVSSGPGNNGSNNNSGTTNSTIKSKGGNLLLLAMIGVGIYLVAKSSDDSQEEQQ